MINKHSLKRLFLSLLLITVSVGLLACRTTVPQPSMPLQALNSPIPKYKMHNIGPQQAAESQSVHYVDLNQDGHLDLLVGGHEDIDGFHVEWGDSTGNWVLQGGPLTAMQPRSIATADINHDNNIEILIGGEGDQKGLQVWALNSKTQTWTIHSSPLVSGVFHAVKFADINEDGWQDIIAVRSDSIADGGIYVLLNDGRNGWVHGTGPMVKGIFTSLSVEDINGDEHLDIIAARRGGLGAMQGRDQLWSQAGGVQVWFGDGNARWEPMILPTNADTESVTVADINSDGYLDIVAGLYQQGIRYWLGGEKTWSMQSVVQSGTWSDVRVGDLNADGDKELVASSSVGQGIAIWSWKDSRFISEDHQVPDYGVYLDLDLGDVKSNGQLDIAATRADGGVEIWSTTKAKPLPMKKFLSKQVGERLSIYFDSGTARLNPESIKKVNVWVDSLGIDLSELHLELQGRADQRPIHSELYPNNTALSKARADAVATTLLRHNAKKENLNIDALGDKSPLPPGLDPASLRQNRRVFVEAFKIESTKLPLSASNINKRDLYNIDENKVFKTIDGVPEYKVGVGDELQITFWQGAKSEIQKVIVQIDGTVSLPYQAALKVAGLTPREIDSLTTNIIKKYERNPRVDIQVLRAKSKFASIFGEVQSLSRQPTGAGTYALRGKESLVDFLSRVGGPTKEANLNNVQIIRDGKTVLLDLNRAIRQGDLSENAIIDDGDTIFIPSLAQSKRQVYVLGQVAKAGIVEFTGDINFLDAISKAGGLTDDAYLPDIRVLRADRDQPQILAVNFQRFLENGDLTQNIALMDKDVLIIPSRPIANWNKFIADISPSITLLLQPVSIAQQILTLRLLTGQVQ
ncbi:MAG: FG-GAP-like repeat-containing protein [Ghiorsea sp.]|nr:FG-GAP-like repeat-containing protein [Ghiorsea sp.]